MNCHNCGLGDIADPDSFTGQMDKAGAKNAAIKKAYAAKLKANPGLAEKNARILKRNLARIKVVQEPGAAGKTLNKIEKKLQKMILARDWDALFSYVHPKLWGQFGNISKYSFVTKNGARIYVPFTEDEIRNFVYSKYYLAKPGWVCSETQRENGFIANWNAAQSSVAKYPPSNPLHVFPINPGWGFPGSRYRYQCDKPIKSSWVKIRKVAVVAAAAVAAIYLGPIVAEKFAALGAGSAGEAGGIVGAGSKAGAAAKAGLVTKGTAASAAGAASTFGQIKATSANLLGYVNKARTVDAIVKGELPPPPIGVSGNSFKEWAFSVAKDELMKSYGRKLTRKEEQKLQAEINAMQNEIAKIVPPGTPMQANPGVPGKVRRVMAKEKQTMENIKNVLMIAVPVGLAYLAM